MSATPGGAHYLLGHGASELCRLDLQDDLYRDVTRRGLRAAGLAEGMRVLDLGCGTGGVSLVTSELVGPSGSVFGIDRREEPLEVARRHATRTGRTNIEFVRAEVADLRPADEFDALVGRFVLMHQPDPVSVLAEAAQHVRNGGAVAFIESYMALLAGGVHSEPFSEPYDRIVRWKCAVVEGAGADCHAGGRLRNTLARAGLRSPATRLEARLEGGPDSPYYRYVAESVRSMLPEARRLGLPGFSESDLHDLEDRLRDEVIASGGALVAWPVVVGWATK